MLLSKPDLINYIEEKKLKFDPYIDPHGDRVDQVSINLSLGKQFTVQNTPGKHVPHIHVDSDIWKDKSLWTDYNADTFILEPGQFVLAKTLERVTIPNDLVGLIEGRSTWGRIGITIHVTAPKIDPGFDGTITLEMLNVGKFKVQLRAGIDKPAQLMLVKLSTALKAHQTYGNKPTDIFQGQTQTIPRKKS